MTMQAFGEEKTTLHFINRYTVCCHPELAEGLQRGSTPEGRLRQTQGDSYSIYGTTCTYVSYKILMLFLNWSEFYNKTQARYSTNCRYLSEKKL